MIVGGWYALARLVAAPPRRADVDELMTLDAGLHVARAGRMQEGAALGR